MPRVTFADSPQTVLYYLQLFTIQLPLKYTDFIALYSRTDFILLVALKSLLLRKIIQQDFYDDYLLSPKYKNEGKIIPIPNFQEIVLDLDKKFSIVEYLLDIVSNTNRQILFRFVRAVEQIEDSQEDQRFCLHLVLRLFKFLPALFTFISQNVVNPILTENENNSTNLTCNCTIYVNTTANVTYQLDNLNVKNFLFSTLGVAFTLTFISEIIKTSLQLYTTADPPANRLDKAILIFYTLCQGFKVATIWNLTSFFAFIKNKIASYTVPIIILFIITFFFKYLSDSIREIFRPNLSEIFMIHSSVDSHNNGGQRGGGGGNGGGGGSYKRKSDANDNIPDNVDENDKQGLISEL